MSTDVVTLLLQYRWELFGFIRAIVRHTPDAEDLFQEVAAAIVKKAGEGAEIRDFRAWSKEIARRQILKHYRDRRNERTVRMPVEEMVDVTCRIYAECTPALKDLTDEHEALRHCMEKLPAKSADLIRSRFLSSQSYAEIAGRIQQSEVAIRRAVARARLALLDCVRRRLHPVAENL